jgi:ABC-2 type transport system ATP-binding protein
MIENSDILLQARELGRREGPQIRVAKINLELTRGQALGLLGVNGAGKSTTLSLLSGVLRPTSGRVAVLGLDLQRQPRQAKRHLGLVPERPPLYPNLTVDENLDFAARLHGLARGAVAAARQRVKAQLGLEAFGRRLASRLSRGMAQRVAIGQALLHRPEVLILDEPTAGLDPEQAGSLRQLLAELRPHCALVLASHILLDVERLCDQVLVLRSGRVVAQETLGDDEGARIRLLRPPTAAALAALPGVKAVHPGEAGWFLLELEHPPAYLARQIALRDWGLAAFVPVTHDLEALLLASAGAEAA